MEVVLKKLRHHIRGINDDGSVTHRYPVFVEEWFRLTEADKEKLATQSDDDTIAWFMSCVAIHYHANTGLITKGL